MNRHMRLSLALGLWLLAVLAACSAGGAAVSGGVQRVVASLPTGQVLLESHGCPQVNVDAAERALNHAGGRAARENVAVLTNTEGCVLMGCGQEGALSHEPGHYWAHELKLHCRGPRIWREPGYTLSCERLPG